MGSMKEDLDHAPIRLKPAACVRWFSLACWCTLTGEEAAFRAAISAWDGPFRGTNSGRLGEVNNAMRDALSGCEEGSSALATFLLVEFCLLGPGS